MRLDAAHADVVCFLQLACAVLHPFDGFLCLAELRHKACEDVLLSGTCKRLNDSRLLHRAHVLPDGGNVLDDVVGLAVFAVGVDKLDVVTRQRVDHFVVFGFFDDLAVFRLHLADTGCDRTKAGGCFADVLDGRIGCRQ